MPSAKRSAWWNTLICTLRNCAVELCPRGEVVSVYCAPVAARHPLRVILTWFSLRHHRESGGGGREVQRRAAPLPPPTQLLLPCVPSSFPSATTQTGPKTEPPPKSFALPFPLLSLEPSCLLSLPPSPVVGSVCSLWDQLVFSLRSRLARTGGARESARHKKGG